MILKKYFLFLLFISIVGLSWSVNNSVMATELSLVQLARMSVERYLEGTVLDYEKIYIKNDDYNSINGVFVTIIDKNNKSRGCWGNLYPQTDLKEAVVIAAVGAVKKDYRYEPLSLSELPEIKFQVSVVLNVVPVSSVREINPLRDGLLVQSGSKGGILMPGESVDAYYQMVQCKLKADIQPGEPYNLFKLITKVYKE